MRSFILFCLSFLLLSNLFAQEQISTDYSKFVDPYIGTLGDGNTFVGATYPFGMVKLGSDCDALNTNSGYSTEGKIRGFSHLHVSGTGGGPKYGNILVYPFMGDVQVSGYGSNRGKEKAHVGYFSVELTDSNILAELTSTHKTGMHRYTFSKPEKKSVLIDAGSFLGKEWCCFENQELVGSEISILSDTEIAGYNRVKGGWNMGGAYTVYFYAVFDTPAESFGTWKSGIKHSGSREEYDSGEAVGAWFSYTNKYERTINLKVGISFVSTGKPKKIVLMKQLI